MKNFIVAFAVSVVLLSCTTDQSKKLDVVEQINQDMIKDPSAAGSTGTNYYVCDDGDDANDGLSEETPWKTFDKAIKQFNEIEAGDAVLLCRGGSFVSTYSQRISNLNCLAEDACIFSDYYNYNTQVEDQRPRILSTHAGHIFNFQDGRWNQDQGYIVENLIIAGRKKGEGTAVFFYANVDDVVLNNLTIESVKIAVQVAGSGNERITLSNVNAINVDHKLFGDADGFIGTGDEENIVVNSDVGNGVEHYFVCDADGSDSNDGLSPAEPFRTFLKGMSKFNGLKAGGSISFCRGGEFLVENEASIFNQNCLPSDPCVIQDYIGFNQVGNKLPVLKSMAGVGVLKFSDGGSADSDGGYLIKNLELKANDIGKGAGIFIYNEVNDLTIDNLTINGFNLGLHLAGTGGLNEGANGVNDRFFLQNSRIINNSGQGLLGACSNCLITNNIFDNNGYERAILNHNIYIGGTVENITISKNILRRSAVIDGMCRGVSLVVHGIANNLTIENNLIEESVGVASHGCWGIAVDPGYSKEESFTNLTIRNNDVFNMGNVSIGCSSCVDVQIEGNRITTSKSLGGTFIVVPNKPEDSVLSENITIKNNMMMHGDQEVGITAIITKLINDEPVVVGNTLYSKFRESKCLSINGEHIESKLACEYKK